MASHGHSHGGGQCNHSHGGGGFPQGMAGIPQGLFPGGHSHGGGGIGQTGMGGIPGMVPVGGLPMPAMGGFPIPGQMGGGIPMPSVGKMGGMPMPRVGNMSMPAGVRQMGGMPAGQTFPMQGIQMQGSPMSQGGTGAAGGPVPGAMQVQMPPQMALLSQMMAQDSSDPAEEVDIFEALDAARSSLNSVAHTCGEPGTVCAASHGSQEEMKKKMAAGQKIMKLLMKNPAVIDQKDLIFIGLCRKTRISSVKMKLGTGH
ncbi:heavy metal-associated isoprenylated plant protein 33-like [Lingula anatina]|uniref:Heavy metal-associated isoprenylated plant protein 33-like n=1 Tax=Lingula anatina TaxID=7574 RepID=A0A1S3JAK9_LINAN|nr:heavy metal-associated isoprenylated plant protein 33-like [Lingula anatina]|eukprot:XP_013407358.1 heavy metal-associated isoprenylated plant protein 33-like [Lingula anatina]